MHEIRVFTRPASEFKRLLTLAKSLLEKHASGRDRIAVIHDAPAIILPALWAGPQSVRRVKWLHHAPIVLVVRISSRSALAAFSCPCSSSQVAMTRTLFLAVSTLD